MTEEQQKKRNRLFRIFFYLFFALLFVGMLVYTLAAGRVGVSLFTGSDKYYGDKTFEDGGAAFSQRITVLDIGWVAGRVNIVVSDTEGDRILVRESADTVLDAKEEMTYAYTDGVLRLRFAEKKAIFFANYKEPKELTVTIPRAMSDYLEEITLNSVSADFTLSGFTGTEVRVTTKSGRISLSDVTVKRMILSDSEGNVSLDACRLDHLILTGKKGSLRLTGLSGLSDVGMEHCLVQTSDGEISLLNLAAEHLSVETRKGKTTLNGVSAAELSVTSRSGAVDLSDCETEHLLVDTLSAPVVWKSTHLPTRGAEISTRSGNVSLFFSPESAFALTFGTATGSEDCDFPGLSLKDGVMTAGHGEEGAELLVDTVSGNLILRTLG